MHLYEMSIIDYFNRIRYNDSMKHGFFRTACASPPVVVADCDANAQEIILAVQHAAQDNVQCLVFPELCITSYTCADLFLQDTLITGAKKALLHIVHKTQDKAILFVVGIPLLYGNSLYNCAVFIAQGKILAIVPKVHIPNYSEFYELRHFASANTLATNSKISLSDDFQNIPFGTNILVRSNGTPSVCIAAEICEDLWVPSPPSIQHALTGAQIILNLSASNEVVGKADYRRLLVRSQSGRLCAAYVYANAGKGESTTDLVFSAHNIIAENGSILIESELYSDGYIVQDIDIELINHERQRISTFCTTPLDKKNSDTMYRIIDIPPSIENSSIEKKSKMPTLKRHIAQLPFVPNTAEQRSERCKSIITMQAEGLAKRIRHIGVKNALIGLSGGLDSTLALLVTVEAFKRCNLPIAEIRGITMPCFGTTDRTYKNAVQLAQELGIHFTEIPIKKAVQQHFSDIGHSEDDHTITYENAQARERTQILMDIANKIGGLVIGTGDLSELALGWATYNGDHMSMYGVNSSIPKTLVRYLVEWFSLYIENDSLSSILSDILDTPVSPELLPPQNGSISQKTEELVGPYELHDFFLYYVVRRGFGPEKILFLAKHAFCTGSTSYSPQIIHRWLTVFYTRFFSQQFKRSCMPDGAKVGTVSFSPRGDWRMPSDASCRLWLKELERLR